MRRAANPRMSAPETMDKTDALAFGPRGESEAGARARRTWSRGHALNPIVQVGAGAGAVRFGADLPLALIAGPCQLESRAHALEIAAALKEIAARLKLGLVFKTSFDKANRTSGAGARGIGLEAALPIFAEIRDSARPAGAHRRARARPMRARRRSRRRAADPGLPLPPDRPARRRGATGRAVNVKKGQFLAPWDMKHVVAKIAAAGGTQRAGHRARRQLRLQHAGLRHARAADHGARHRRAGDLRRHPFGAAAGRAGRVLGRPARIRRRCWRARRSRSASPACSSRPIRTPTTRPPTAPTWSRCADFEALVAELQDFDRLAKAAPIGERSRRKPGDPLRLGGYPHVNNHIGRCVSRGRDRARRPGRGPRRPSAAGRSARTRRSGCRRADTNSRRCAASAA